MENIGKRSEDTSLQLHCNMFLAFCLGWSQVSKEYYGVAVYVVDESILDDAHVLGGFRVNEPGVGSRR